MKRYAPLLVAVPPIAMAIGGLFHPQFLTPDTAHRWFVAHCVLLPLFPLVGLALWWVLRGVAGPLATGARLLTYAYAVLYTALDSISGVGLGYVTEKAAERGQPGPDLGTFFYIGDRIGHPGAVCLAIAGVLAGVALFQRDGWPAAVGGAFLTVGALLVWKHHVFPYKGVLGMVAIAVGLALFVLPQVLAPGRAEQEAPVPA